MKTLQSPRSKIARGVLLIAAIATLSAILLVRHQTRSSRAAEQYALDFVRMHGFISDGYTSSRLRRLFAPFLGATKVGTIPRRTASISVNEMTDNMAMSLIDIHHLHGITLYPPDPDGSGVDFAATTLTQCASLRELDLPLSEKGIAILEERCPDLVIQVASRPSTDSASSTDLGK
jgi:hypothetical protein